MHSYNIRKTNKSMTMKIMIGIILTRRRLKKPLWWLRKANNNKLNSSSNTTPMYFMGSKYKGTYLSNSAPSNNHPLNTYRPMSSSSESSSSSSPSSSTTRPSPQEDQSSIEEEDPAAGIVDTEEQSMRNPTSSTISHGFISVIGRRRYMEDAVTVAPDLIHVTKPHSRNNKKEMYDEQLSYDFFAVYDGHGVAQRYNERLHHIVAEQRRMVDRWESVMETSFARLDDEIAAVVAVDGVSHFGKTEDSFGSTALVVLVGKEEIVVANCGDSRVVLVCNGAVLSLSRDSSKQPDGKDRVRAAGDGYVIPVPEVTVHKRAVSDCFLVIASDGLWNVVSNETVCELVSMRLLDGTIGNCAAASAAMLVELALARGSKDNISVIVVQLQPS